jgi:hypothetical protein
VHGTTITVLNAARKYLNKSDVKGVVYVSSGLGGMSGAQTKAAKIAGCVGVIAEVDYPALKKRYDQGWVNEIITDAKECVARTKLAKKNGEAIAIGFHGNIVTLWEAFAEDPESVVDLGSDQTSLHNPFMGGYFPVQISHEESKKMMSEDPPKFKGLVQETLRRHVAAVNKLTNEKGMKFWDYGNAFLRESYRAGAEIMTDDSGRALEDGGSYRCVRAQQKRVVGRIGANSFFPPQVPVLRAGHYGRRLLPRLRPLPLGVLLRAPRGPRHHRPDRRRGLRGAHEDRQRKVPRAVPGQPHVDQGGRQEQDGRGQPGQDPVLQLRGPREARRGVQQGRAGRPPHDARGAVQGPPRRERHRLPLQGDEQHRRREHLLRRHGHPERSRRRREGRHLGQHPQRRRLRLGRSHQRRLRHGEQQCAS